MPTRAQQQLMHCVCCNLSAQWIERLKYVYCTLKSFWNPEGYVSAFGGSTAFCICLMLWHLPTYDIDE